MKKMSMNQRPPIIPDYDAIRLSEDQQEGIQQEIEEQWPQDVMKMKKNDVIELLSKISSSQINDDTYFQHFNDGINPLEEVT